MSSPDPETIRVAAQQVADALSSSPIGGACYHGDNHSCFTRQGRRPLALYKSEEMCERCQISWHALMTVALFPSVMLTDRLADRRLQLHEEPSHAEPPSCVRCGREFKRNGPRLIHERNCKGRMHETRKP